MHYRIHYLGFIIVKNLASHSLNWRKTVVDLDHRKSSRFVLHLIEKTPANSSIILSRLEESVESVYRIFLSGTETDV